jgi:hypothetical protein
MRILGGLFYGIIGVLAVAIVTAFIVLSTIKAVNYDEVSYLSMAVCLVSAAVAYLSLAKLGHLGYDSFSRLGFAVIWYGIALYSIMYGFLSWQRDGAMYMTVLSFGLGIGSLMLVRADRRATA